MNYMKQYKVLHLHIHVTFCHQLIQVGKYASESKKRYLDPEELLHRICQISGSNLY